MDESDTAGNYLSKKFDIGDDFKNFNSKFDIFNRSQWDEKIDAKNLFISYDIANYVPKKAKGFDHWDYALRNASWHLTDVVGELKYQAEGRVEGFTDYFTTSVSGPSKKVKIESEADTARRVKVAARTLGAGSVGICELDRRWLYSHHFNRKDMKEKVLTIPETFTHVVVLIIPMDYQLGRTFPSALSGSTTGHGYAQCLNACTSLAQFITNLGYEALASMNDTALNIPLAIQAGLGEYGRHGLLITPQFGPNVRIAKVFTNLPMAIDRPIEFGVTQFCAICKKCSDSCPVKAIPADEPLPTPPNESSHKGIKKWTVNAEKCFKFWVGMNTDCAICIRVCPYNKDYTKWWNRVGIKLANSPLRKMMLWLDKKLKYGIRYKSTSWWQDNFEALN